MILDASVLVALLREEPETARFIPLMNEAFGSLKMSVANFLEAAIVIDSNEDEVLSERLDRVIRHFAVELIPVSLQQVRMARRAYRMFGKGNHPAGLNFGDCFAYALARDLSELLLFKGNDFAKTDIEAASLPPFPSLKGD